MKTPFRLYQTEVEDQVIRENFFRIQNYVRDDVIRKAGWRFLEFTVDAAVSNLEIPHKLNYVPLDIITLSVRNDDATTVTWHYDDFDQTSIVVTTSGPCTVRAYVGRYGES